MRLIGGEWKRCKACSRPVLIRRGLDLSFVTLKCSCLLYSFEGTPQQRNPVAIAEWFHLFPSRTQSLSTHTSKVLGWRRPGRIESCWLMTHPQGCVFILESRHLCFDVQQGLLRHLLEHDVRIDYAHVMVEGIPQDAVPRIADVELFRSCIV